MKKRELFLRNLWLILKRAPRDRRAFGLLISWLGLVAWLLYEVGTMYYLGIWGTLCVLGMLLLAVMVVVWMAHSRRRADESLFRLTSHPAPAEYELAQHAHVIAAELLRAAVLVDRSAGEALTKQGKIPEQNTGQFRARTLAVAQRSDVCPRFTAREKSLLTDAEGSWQWPEIGIALLLIENVRVMRWALCLDQVLTPFEFLDSDLTPALALTTNPDRLPLKQCLAPYDLRPAQSMSYAMLNRCAAENVRRGTFSPDDPAAAKELLALADRMNANPGGDLLSGEKTVGETSSEKLQWLGQTAFRRARATEALIAYLNGPATAMLHLPGL